MGLKIVNLEKSFGDKKAVTNLSLSMEKPGIFGLIGTNGAGKTTTIRMILGILKKDHGEISWNGKEIERKNINFGYLPEERGIYPKTKIYDQLMYFARLKGSSKQDADKAIHYWLKKMEIEEYINKPAEMLSKGNQQKVQIVSALINDPELIILDEPFSGLDPVNTQLIKNVISQLVKKQKYIIMSSHQMNVVEEFCTDILILNKGQTVLQGNLKQIRQSYDANKVEINVNSNIDTYINEIRLEIIENKENDYLVKIENEKQGQQLLTYLIEKGVKINKYEVKKPSLNDIFIERTTANEGYNNSN